MSERQERSYEGKMMDKGKVGEVAVNNWLDSKGYKVIDVRSNKTMQNLDVDIVYQTQTGASYLCEVKADYNAHKTKNICFETMRIYHNTATFDYGWAIKTPADYLFYTLPETGEIYIFNFGVLRERVVDYIKRVGKNVKSIVVETDAGKTTHGFLIPLSELENAYTHAQLTG